MTPRDIITPADALDIKQHALDEYPNECLGVVTPNGYVRLQNVSDAPTVEARAPFKQISEMIVKKNALALIHSHPDGNAAPSRADMATQMTCAIPFGIVWTNGQTALDPFFWGDHMKREPLIGRGFRHGVTDCYALVRDYYLLEHDVYLNDYPRSWEWWARGDDLYSENFAKEGFVEIDPSEIRPGDAILFHIRWSKDETERVINHAGIYVGDGLLLHHVASRSAWDPDALSRREPMGRWASRMMKVLRYAEKDLSSRSS